MLRSLCLLCCAIAATDLSAQTTGMNPAATRSDYSVIEFRRYTIKPGQRERFASRFESFFPGAIQQTGAIVAGEFLERANPSVFTWIRCFHELDDRARLNAALYYGPVWKEHRSQMNELLVDSDNVLLLRPLDPHGGVAILPAVDPASEIGTPRGVVIAQVFRIVPEKKVDVQQEATRVFDAYRLAGAREAGVLVSLETPNNFPQLPIRTDGPYLVYSSIPEQSPSLTNHTSSEARFRGSKFGNSLIGHQSNPLVEAMKPSFVFRAVPLNAAETRYPGPTGTSGLFV